MQNGSSGTQNAFPAQAVFFAKTAFYFLMLSVGIAGIAALHGPACVPFQILAGVMMAHGVELQHQALHGGFRNRALNRWAGFLLGLPMLVSFSAYQSTHLKHHRYAGTPQDRESFDYGELFPFSPPRLAAYLLMLPHYRQFAARAACALRNRRPEEFSEKTWARVRAEYLVMLAALAGACGLSVALKSPLVAFIWFVPAMLIAAPAHVLIELPEHYGCDPHSRNVFENTRTIRSNRFMTWLTNGNNFHVEHHFRPGVPVEKLRQLHGEIAQNVMHGNDGYAQFYAGVLGDLLLSRAAQTRALTINPLRPESQP